MADTSTLNTISTASIASLDSVTVANIDAFDGFSIEPSIETDVAALEIAWESGSYSGYCAIDVKPNTMETTITKVDTGDGTGWVGDALPATGTGDYSFRFRAASDNSTGSPRSLTARISDDSSAASSVDVTVTQQPEPI